MAEFIDVFDEDCNPTGETVCFDEAHARKLWHKVIKGHILTPRGELLLSLRAPNVMNNPNKWDCGFAGHVNAGEDFIQAG